MVTDREDRGQASYPALTTTTTTTTTTAKRRGCITTCGNNGAGKVVTDREDRGQASHPALLLSPRPPDPPPSISQIMPSCTGAGIAHFADSPTEMIDAILTRVRVPYAARHLFPRVNFQRRLSYAVRTALVCNRMHKHLCTR